MSRTSNLGLVHRVSEILTGGTFSLGAYFRDLQNYLFQELQD